MRTISAFVAALGPMSAEERERWIQLFPPGVHDVAAMTGPARILADRRGADQAAEALRAAGRPCLFDYEHRSLLASDRADSRASGWLHEVAWDDERGIVGRVQFTPAALRAVREGEYRYVSPVVEHDADTGEIYRIMGGTLTNDPAIKNQEALAALRSQSPLAGGDSTAQTGKEKNMDELMQQLRAALGLPETATRDEIVARFLERVRACDETQTALTAARAALGELAALAGADAQADAQAQVTAVRTALQAARTTDAGGDAVIAALRSDVAALQAANAELSRQARDAEFERIMTPLRAEGRTAPAEERGLRLMFDQDRAAFDAMIGARKPGQMVPLKAGPAPAESAPASPDAVQAFAALVSARERELIAAGVPSEAAYARAWSACKQSHPAEYRAAGGR